MKKHKKKVVIAMNKQKVIDWYYEHTVKDEHVFIFRFLLDDLKMEQMDIPLWLKDENTADILDMDYCTVVSGDKYLSQNFIRQYERYNIEVLRYFAMILYKRFGTKWNKIYEALNVEYNPLENYSSTEIETPNLIDTSKANSKVTVKQSGSTFDSAVYQPYASTETAGSEDDNKVTTTKTGTRTVTKSGNIGVTTSQQMLQSEFEVRQYDFYQGVYNDIDEFITTLKW